MNEFYQFYQESIRNTLRSLEIERREAAFRYKQIKIIQIIVLAVLAMFVTVYLFGGTSLRKVLVISLLLFYLFLTFGEQRKAIAKNYTNKMKLPILKKVLSKWGNFEISKIKLPSLLENSLKIASELNKNSHNLNIYSKKHLIGKADIGELDFILAENIIKRDKSQSKKSKLTFKEKVIDFIENIDRRIEGKEVRYIMAVYFYIDNSDQRSKIFILPQKASSIIDKYYNNVKKVKIKNLNFDEKYNVWSDDSKIVEKVSCNLFFDSLADDQQIYLGDLSVFIDGNKGVVCLEMMYDVCYFGINNELDNGGKFADIANIAESLIDIVSRIKKSF